VVDATGQGVPCVELETTNALEFRTDASGRVAFYEPELMGQVVWLHVSGAHVSVAPDAFDFEGAALNVAEGGEGSIVVDVVGAPACDPGDRATLQLARGVPDASDLVAIHVRDQDGAPVPLAQLVAGDQRYVSDSEGWIAFDLIGLGTDGLDAQIASSGYVFEDEGELQIPTAPGQSMEVTATAVALARRAYRITGEGIRRHATILGRSSLDDDLALRGKVVGQDSSFATVHDGRIHWIWGDTNRPAYPLGNFHASGATSPLPSKTSRAPADGVLLDYFVDETGFSRAMAPTDAVPGDGVTWLAGLVSLPSEAGPDRMHATFAMVEPDFSVTRFGMLVYDDEAEHFVEGVDFDLARREGLWPHENALVIDRRGEAWVHYHNPVRISARSEALLDTSTYERFTPYQDAEATTIERDDQGRAVYRWRAGEIPYVLASADDLDPADRLEGHIRDVRSGDAFEAHGNGDTTYNHHIGRYMRLITPRWALGATWVAYSDTLMGPWVYATELIAHENYTFYNPRRYPFYDLDGGATIHFEATYTRAFSGSDDRTPRYDYNQLMCRVDLTEPQLALPVPVYRSPRAELGPASVLQPEDPPIAARPVWPRSTALRVAPIARPTTMGSLRCLGRLGRRGWLRVRIGVAALLDARRCGAHGDGAPDRSDEHDAVVTRGDLGVARSAAHDAVGVGRE